MKEVFEKIIERLDKKRKYYGDNALSIFVTDGYTVAGVTNDAKEDAYADAIEIVKEVAEEYEKSEPPNLSENLTSSNEFCEWFKYDYRTIAPKNHDVDNPYWRMPEDMSKLRFCPYCSKMIKVVK